jgi:toxin HigB-1
MRLDRLEAAPHMQALRGFPGNRLEALKGKRAGQHSIRINDQWRICFKWPSGSPGPIDVEITDYHD